jgi:putative acetyltransferase
MIRKFNQSDIEEVINIWLECSYISHDFINRDFWNSQTEDMKKIYIPASETYIFEENEKIIGFISYYE